MGFNVKRKSLHELALARLVELDNSNKLYKEKVQKHVIALIRLEELLGRNIARDGWCISHPRFEIKRSDLIELRRKVGKLKMTGKSAASCYGQERTVQVDIEFEDKTFEGISFFYFTELSANAKCQIVTKTSTYQTLVCEK